MTTYVRPVHRGMSVFYLALSRSYVQRTGL